MGPRRERRVVAALERARVRRGLLPAIWYDLFRPHVARRGALVDRLRETSARAARERGARLASARWAARHPRARRPRLRPRGVRVRALLLQRRAARRSDERGPAT